MKLYRIAERNNISQGMYRGLNSPGIDGEASERHPMPDEDEGLRRAWNNLCQAGLYDKYLFGFSSREQAACWLYTKEIRSALDRCGYVVFEVKAYDYATGDTQAVFRRGAYDVLAQHDIIEFLDRPGDRYSVPDSAPIYR